MEQTLTTKIKKKKGFTLIELIVVIAIIGILAAIAVPRLSGFRSSSETAANNATRVSITKSIEAASAAGRLGAGTVIATPATNTGIVAWTGTATVTAANNPAAITSVDAVMDDLMGEVRLQGTTVVHTWTIDASGNVTGPTTP